MIRGLSSEKRSRPPKQVMANWRWKFSAKERPQKKLFSLRSCKTIHPRPLLTAPSPNVSFSWGLMLWQKRWKLIRTRATGSSARSIHWPCCPAAAKNSCRLLNGKSNGRHPIQMSKASRSVAGSTGPLTFYLLNIRLPPATRPTFLICGGSRWRSATGRVKSGLGGIVFLNPMAG